MSNIHKRTNAVDIIIHAILFCSMLACLLPILNTIAISFSDKTSAGLGRVFFWPVNFTITPYTEILKDQQFFRSFFNSVERVVLGGGLNVILVILTAYPLSKNVRDFKWKNTYMWFLIFTMLFNGGLIPTYLVVMKTNLIDHIWALVIPGSVNVFNVLILMNNYRALPASLEEAAKMDGANPLYILWKIYIPLTKPTIAVITLFSVVNHWNEFFYGLIYMNSPENYPLQSYIQSLNVNIDFSQIAQMDPKQVMKMMEVSSLTFNSAKLVASMIPIVILYPVIQRYFVTGMVMGAVKE